MAHILSYGSLNLDLVYQVPHFVQAGETLSSTSRTVHCGGKGLNQSIAAARAGGTVSHAGKIGEDGTVLTDILRERGVDTDFVTVGDGPSGHAVIQVDPSGQNCILLFGGCNQEITPEEIDRVLARFQAVDDSVWFPKQDKIFADFSIVMSDSSKMVSFLGHRQVDYSHIQLNPVIPDRVLKMDNNVIIDNNVLKNDDRFWDTIRPYALSGKEKQIYGMVDSIKNVPLYQNIYTIVSMVLGGYYDTEYVEWGPYYKLLSFNKQEGCRFQLGARTTTDFSKKIRLFGYGAYGTKDRRWKGAGGFDYSFNDLPTSKLSAAFKHDVVQLGAGINAFTEGNILSSIFSRGDNDRLSMVNQLDVNFEKEWRQGVSNTFGVQVRDLFSNPYVPFVKPDGELMPSVQSTIVRLNTRLSKDEIVVRKAFDKYSLGSDYPIIGVDLG